MIQSDLGKAAESEWAICVGMYLGHTDVVRICICIYPCRDVQNSYICGYAVTIISFTVPKGLREVPMLLLSASCLRGMCDHKSFGCLR